MKDDRNSFIMQLAAVMVRDGPEHTVSLAGGNDGKIKKTGASASRESALKE